MYKNISKACVMIIYIFMWGGLLFGMSIIRIPITNSFETKAEMIADGYYRISIPDNNNCNIKYEEMYIRSNKNETFVKVSIKQEGQYIFFKNEDFGEALYTYELVTGDLSLLECIFLRGGRTIE